MFDGGLDLGKSLEGKEGDKELWDFGSLETLGNGKRGKWDGFFLEFFFDLLTYLRLLFF